MIIDYAQAILRLVPKAGFQVKLNDLSTLNWESDPDLRPSDAEIEESLVQLQAEYDALAWKRSREENYPSIAELTVALYDTDDKSAVEAKRAAVKAKYPKP